MKYRIRKWVSRTPNTAPLYYPQYKRRWYHQFWSEGKGYEWASDAQKVIDAWIENGVPEESHYIKYP